MGKDYSSMTVRQLEELRSLMLDRMAAVPAFRRGSLQVGYRKCGRASCRCARPGERGHGPRGLWTRTVKGDGTRGQYVPVEQVEQVRAELDNYAQFETLVADYVEINEALCKAKTGPPAGARTRASPVGSDGKKGGPGPGKSPTGRRRASPPGSTTG
jgi:hypothetical protein